MCFQGRHSRDVTQSSEFPRPKSQNVLRIWRFWPHAASDIMASTGLSPMTYVCGLESFSLQSKQVKLGIWKKTLVFWKNLCFFPGYGKNLCFYFSPQKKEGIRCSRYIYTRASNKQWPTSTRWKETYKQTYKIRGKKATFLASSGRTQPDLAQPPDWISSMGVCQRGP